MIGCDAGFLNMPRIKGSHAAMKTGMLAAEAAFERVSKGSEGRDELTEYTTVHGCSTVWDISTIGTLSTFCSLRRRDCFMGVGFV